MSAIAARRRPLARRLPGLASRALAVLLAGALVYPLVAMLVESLRPPGLSRHGAFTPGLESFRQAFDWVPLGQALLNSLGIAAWFVPLTLAVASMAGVGMALLSRQRQVVLITALLLVASIPLTAVWIPRFVMFEALGAVGTWVPLVAPALAGGSPLFVLLFYVAARRLPPDLLDTARLEGVGALGLWWRVALPLMRPTTVAVALLAFAQSWGNFIEATLYLKSEAQLTAPLMLHALELMGSTQWPVLMAGAIVVTAPVLLACLALQGLFAAPEREGAWSGP